MHNEHMPPREFKESGLLMEANRLFFHPRGVALEMAVVDDDGKYEFPMTYVGLDAKGRAILQNLLDGEQVSDADKQTVREALDSGDKYEPGDCYLSGIRVSDDPESIVFGEWSDEDREKVADVEARREQHRDARINLFFPDGDTDGTLDEADIEPVGWVPEATA